ncbi:hypothetical protein [Streptomyces sp. NPDC055189]
MRSRVRLAAIAVLAGTAITLTAGTATAGDEQWPRGTGVVPANDEPWPSSAGAGTGDSHLSPLYQGKAPWSVPSAGTGDYGHPAGVDPDYPLSGPGNEYWPKGSG